MSLTVLASGLALYASAMTGMWWAAKSHLDDVKRDREFWKRRYHANEEYIQKLRDGV